MGLATCIDSVALPERVKRYPPLRFMGSKYRLLPWIHQTFAELEYDAALDAFSGSGCVSYLLKTLGKRVTSNDFLHFCATIADATVANSGSLLTPEEIDAVGAYDPRHRHFISRTFKEIFFSPADLRFLDLACWNLRKLDDPRKRSVACAALIRSCAKRQPRGVFTVAGDPDKYKDGRRDLRLSLREHFIEQAGHYNAAVFDNGRENRALRGDVFDLDPSGFDLVYFDPPYVPRSDDNCYVKRYHFLEGLSRYWEDMEIVQTSKVKKLKKPFTPFSYRRTAVEAFHRLFAMFSESTLVVSYSSNGFPDLDDLVGIMKTYKSRIIVNRRPHRYHFGTHAHAKRNAVDEYLIVGT